MSTNVEAMPDEPSSSDAARQRTSSMSNIKSRIDKASIIFKSVIHHPSGRSVLKKMYRNLTSLLQLKKKTASLEMPTQQELDKRLRQRQERLDELELVLGRLSQEKHESSGPRQEELQREYEKAQAELDAIRDQARADLAGVVVGQKDPDPKLRDVVMRVADEETKRVIMAEEAAKAQGRKPSGIWAS